MMRRPFSTSWLGRVARATDLVILKAIEVKTHVTFHLVLRSLSRSLSGELDVSTQRELGTETLYEHLELSDLNFHN